MAKRTSLALDSDVDRKLRLLMRQKNKSLRVTVNDLLRYALRAPVSPQTNKRRFRVKAKAMGFAPGIDQGKLNQLSDELADIKMHAQIPRPSKK